VSVTAWVRALLAGAALGGACIAGDDPAPDAAPPGYQLESVQAASGVLEAATPSVCDYLPPDGPCAAACDPETLAGFVPAGSCAVFACTLTDGRTLTVHVCAP
jgi:hypothetical protein